jgi:predicted NBD/HSP70 family sugar kinase
VNKRIVLDLIRFTPGGISRAEITRQMLLTRAAISSLKTEKILALHVAAATRRGALVAQEIITEAGTHLGITNVGLDNLFKPSIVVIGGGVS